MASIRKLPNGTFQATVYVGRDLKGKMIRKYITGDKEKEVRAAARNLETEIAEKKYTSLGTMRASSAFDKWIDLNEHRLSPTTLRPYKIYINLFKTYFGNMKLEQITSIHIQEFLNTLRKGGTIGNIKVKKQSETTILKEFCVLKEILNEYLKSKNPCKDVKPPTKNKKIPTLLTKKQFQKLKEYVRGTNEEIPILLAALCGLRLGEVFGLRWEDIDFENGIIKVRQNLVRTGPNSHIIKEPKSKSGIRDVIASEEILKVLEEYRKKKGIIGGLIIKEDKPENFSRRYERILKKLGLPKSRFHDLRHYRATRMLEAGIPDILASQQLGHSSVSITKEIYQHVTDDIISKSKTKIKKLQ